MKEKITEWLDEQGRDYKLVEEETNENVEWLIDLKHHRTTIIIGKPKEATKRIDVVYKMGVSENHQKALAKMNKQQRKGFEHTLATMLVVEDCIYQMRKGERGVVDFIMIKNHIYEDELSRSKLFHTIQYVVNRGRQISFLFGKLGDGKKFEQDSSPSDSGQSIYR